MKLSCSDYKCSDREDICLYIMIWCFIIITGILVLSNKLINFTLLNKMPPCIFRVITKLNCPVCGGTRAFYSLINGDILKSISYNPIIVYGVTCITPFMIGKTIYYISGKKLCKRIHFMPIFVYMGLVLLFINFLIKNALILLG